jgi:hypothetical protein
VAAVLRVGVILIAAASLALAAGSGPARADDGIPVRGPADGAVFPTSSTIVIEIDEPWFDTAAAGTFDLRIATDPALSHTVYSRTGVCPAGTEPTCQLLLVVGPLQAGTYYWGLEVDFPGEPPHVSDVWMFTVTTPAPSTGTVAYTDPAGDGGGAPDITGVEISSDGQGGLNLHVSIPGLAGVLTGDQRVFLLIDADQRAYSGDPDNLGTEYSFSFSAAGWYFRRWDARTSKWVAALSRTTSGSYSYGASGGGVWFHAGLSDLGGARTTGLNFWAEADAGTGDAVVYDRIPDAGMDNYQLPAGLAAAGAADHIASIVTVTTPGRPVAGKPLHVAAPFVVLGSGHQERPQLVECSASVGRQRLHGRGAGSCTFTIPPRSAGKLLRVSVHADYGSASATKSIVLRIRR